MLIIPIDNMKRKTGPSADPNPKLTIKKNGLFAFNVSAGLLLKLKEGVNHLHFYEDGDKIYIKADNDKLHALSLTNNVKSAKIAVTSKNVANYILHKINPDAEIIYFDVIAADYGKCLITPII